VNPRAREKKATTKAERWRRSLVKEVAAIVKKVNKKVRETEGERARVRSSREFGIDRAR